MESNRQNELQFVSGRARISQLREGRCSYSVSKSVRRMSTQGEGKTEKGKGKGESKKRGPRAHETQNEFNESLIEAVGGAQEGMEERHSEPM